MKHIKKIYEMIDFEKIKYEIEDILVEFKDMNSLNYYKFIGLNEKNSIVRYALVYPMNFSNTTERCIRKCQSILENMNITMIEESSVLDVNFPDKKEIFKQVIYLFKYK